jgi:putative membrane protein
MKNLIILINVAIVFGIVAIFTDPESSERADAKRSKSEIVEVSSQSGPAAQSNFLISKDERTASRDEFVTEFITDIAEARMMDLEEGKIAQQRSTTKDLKSYGALMVNDQTEMLNEIKKLAALKGVELPSSLGENKEKGLNDLKEVHGRSFDKKFIKMMIIDHKRDLKKFERATRSTDADIQVFATKYLPFVQSHLQKIKALK